MKELVEKVAELYAAFEKDAKAQIENGNKAAGTRRKAYDYSAFTEKERSSEKACCCETCCSCTESGNAENGRGIRKGA